jgi:hypothetical protein
MAARKWHASGAEEEASLAAGVAAMTLPLQRYKIRRV